MTLNLFFTFGDNEQINHTAISDVLYLAQQI